MPETTCRPGEADLGLSKQLVLMCSCERQQAARLYPPALFVLKAGWALLCASAFRGPTSAGFADVPGSTGAVGDAQDLRFGHMFFIFCVGIAQVID